MTDVARSRLRLAAIVSAVLGLVLVAWTTRTELRAYGSSDYCTTGCHTKPPKHLEGHKDASCQSCHAIEPGLALRLAGKEMVGSKQVPAHGKVEPARCTACHDKTSATWDRVAVTAGHRKHATDSKVDCLSCHRDTMHGKQTSAIATCAGCHGEERVQKKLHKVEKFDEGASPKCLSCHNFSRPNAATHDGALTTEACARCHESGVQKSADVVPATVISKTGLHGGVDCKLCHDPHKADGDPARPCKDCHQVQIVATNPKLPKEHIQCQSCHEQHKPIASAGSRCVNCHEQARPKVDPKLTSTALRHDQCASCHLPHTWAAAPNECVKCHKSEATLVETQSPGKHQRCTNCHEVHGKPPSGQTCAGCHKENAQKMLAAPAKHQDCVSCHNPHSPYPKVPAACSECHKTPLHQLTTMGPPSHAKASCTSCHTLHGNPKADTKKCATCHKDKGVAVATATKPEHQTCQSCHEPHRFAIDPKSPPCNKCHETISSAIAAGTGIHGGKCTSCHTPHGPPTISREKCLACHEAKVKLKAPNPDHARCSSCHKPHALKSTAPAKCAGCHADKAKIAAFWPANSAHHDACNSCHKPHDVRDKAACGSCHEKEQSGLTASTGKHECKSCHAVHQAPPKERVGWWTKCQGCHEKQAKEVATSKKHDKCSNCHKPHEFAKPDCKSCHAIPASKGLHTAKGHAQCTKCHQTHTASFPTRDDCMACHANKTNHQPEAKVCTGCHLFKM